MDIKGCFCKKSVKTWRAMVKKRKRSPRRSVIFRAAEKSVERDKAEVVTRTMAANVTDPLLLAAMTKQDATERAEAQSNWETLAGERQRQRQRKRKHQQTPTQTSIETPIETPQVLSEDILGEKGQSEEV